MSRADDLLNSLQRAVGDKPFVLLAGAGDLVTEKLRELPEVVSAWQAENRDFPLRAAGALVGGAFRANLKLGELYDDVTRRGEHVMTKMRGDTVYAEEDEPFVHEPYMPEPVRPPTGGGRGRAAKKTAKKVAAKKVAAAKKTAPKKATAKKTAAKKAAAKKTTID